MPYSKKARYRHHRQQQPNEFIKGSFKTVPLNHTDYRGNKYARYMYSGTPAKAIVGKLKSSGNWAIQSILIPK
ncbi:MAG: hypothetical protein ACFFCI_20860 [Promethearchaeota archaeon]